MTTPANTEYDEPVTQFEQDLQQLLNKYNEERLSNTPDTILARYLVSCLETLHTIINRRKTFFPEDCQIKGV